MLATVVDQLTYGVLELIVGEVIGNHLKTVCKSRELVTN